MRLQPLALLIVHCFPVAALAGGVQAPDKILPEIAVEGTRSEQIGIADSANQGTVT